ncbi:MAG: hypothetical protein ACKVWV_00575 [Planctomycetota bacterium]
MNRSVGMTLLVAAAFLFRAGGDAEPTSNGSSPAVEPPRDVQTKSPPRGVGARLLEAHAPCADLIGPSDLPKARVMIATVPDPIASHLDWAFDSHVDAIRRAFERAGYVLDRFEVPWDPTKRTKPQLLGEPGAMLFRRSASPNEASPVAVEPWLVYLVGELSTGGIDRAAFQSVLRERRELIRAEDPANAQLLVVGPVFSGSSPSLRDALAHAGECRVTTGAATSPKNASILARADGTCHFASTLHTDDALLEVIMARILRDGLGLASHHVAVLKESTTDYGQSAIQEDRDGFVSVPFPMSIGSLRKAVVKSDPNDPASTAMPGKSYKASVDLDVYLEQDRAETMFLASTTLTPPSIDLLLEEIARMLAQRDIRAVVILATDVRDKLFLGTELKKRLPDIQLVTTESNVLYLRPELNRWLRGMIVVSTYPLLLRDRSWRPQSSTRDEQLMFANEGAQGTFNAVLVQLDRPQLTADYGVPIGLPKLTDGCERPAVWATVVGAGTMLPLAVYPTEPACSQTPVPLWTTVPTAPQRAGRPDPPRASGRSFLAMLGTSGFALLLLCSIALDRIDAARHGRLSTRILAGLPGRAKHDWRQSADRLERISLALHHELYTLFLVMTMWGLLLPNVLLVCLRDTWSIDALSPARLLGVAALFVGFVWSIQRVRAASRIVGEHGREAREYLHAQWPSPSLRRQWVIEFVLRAGVVFLAVCYVAANMGLAVQIFCLHLQTEDPAAFPLFFHRAIEIDQGVSPLVPLALIGVVLIAWCGWHLARIRLLATRVPGERAFDIASRSRANAQVFVSEVRERLFRILPSAHSVGLFGALSVALCWLWFSFERTLDGLVLRAGAPLPIFDVLFRAGIMGALAGSIWAGYRLTVVWRSFARTLYAHDALLSALPFTAIKKELSVRANLGLWPGSHTRNLPQVARSQWASLVATMAESAGEPACPLSLAAVSQVAETREVQQLEADPEAVRLLDDMIRLLGDACPRVANKEGVDKPAVMPAWRTAMARVVALELLLYVEWVIRHLRRLSYFLFLALVLTTLLISSYPFQPQQLVQTLSLFVFAAIVACLVGLIGSMNRNAALSNMAASEPGELSWDRTLVTNLALYALLPLVTLISAQSPALRKLLTDWLTPLVGFMVKS